MVLSEVRAGTGSSHWTPLTLTVAASRSLLIAGATEVMPGGGTRSSGGQTYRVIPHTNVRVALLTSPSIGGVLRLGPDGQVCLLGLSLTSCRRTRRSLPARLTIRPSSVRTR